MWKAKVPTKLSARASLAIVGLAIGLLATACSASSPGESGGSTDAGVVRFGSYEPTSLDPRTSGILDTKFLEPIYDSLITRTPAGEFEPGLATEWELTDGGTVLDLTLREGVKFQDGADFDAEAVKANIEAAKAPEARRAASLAPIESVDVVDPTHVRLNLSGPGSQLVGVLSGEAGMMISPDAIERGDVETQPVGAGPYEMTEQSPSAIKYRPWDGYWARDTVKNGGLDFIVNPDATTQFRALQSGQIDAFVMLAAQVEEAKGHDGIAVETEATTSLWQVILNPGNPALADPLVRKAILHALDRDAISEAVFAGSCVPGVQPFGEGLTGHVDALADPAAGYDLDKAKQLMSEAGHAEGLTLGLIGSTSTQQQELSAILQAELAKIGITLELEIMDQAQLSAKRRSGEFDMSLSLAPTARPDPTQYVADFYAKDGVNNFGFALDGVEDLLQQARGTTDDAQRGEALQQIVSDVYDAGPPIVPMCSATLNIAFRDGVSGIEVPTVNDYNFASVSAEQQ